VFKGLPKALRWLPQRSPAPKRALLTEVGGQGEEEEEGRGRGRGRLEAGVGKKATNGDGGADVGGACTWPRRAMRSCAARVQVFPEGREGGGAWGYVWVDLGAPQWACPASASAP